MRNHSTKFVLIAMLTLLAAVPAWSQETDPIAVLQSDAPHKAKAAACRRLSIEGGPEAVPVLASLLTDEKLSHMARYALEPMACAEAGEALRNALANAPNPLKVGIIHSLGMRGDQQAVPALIALLASEHAMVAQTAARALGRIATPDAFAALEDALDQAEVPPGHVVAFCDGLLASAEALAEAGLRDQATAIYDRLRKLADAPRQVRTGALRGAVLARGGAQGLPLLVEALHGEDGALFAAAIRTSRELDEDEAVTAALADELDALPPERQIPLMQALGQRGDVAAGPALTAVAKEGPVDVRIAALRALTRMAYSPALELMMHLASSDEAELAKVARDGLSYFPGKGGDEVLTTMLHDKDAKVRRAAVELIGQGGLAAPAGILMKAAQTDADEAVRVAALKTLGRYAGMDEMADLLQRLLQARSPAEVQAAENALEALCQRQERMPSGKVVIRKAVYGGLPDGTLADVTEKVAAIVASGSLHVGATNANFGDPTPGSRKKLRVEYTENGRPLSKTVEEGATLKLTTASAPPVIVDAFCAALDGAKGEARIALLRLLGATGAPKALETVCTVAEGEADAKATALRVLCEWPTPDALPKVMGLVKDPPDPTLKVLALRGAVRMLKQSEAETADLVEHYAVLMANAGTADEKKTVLSGLAQVRHAGALDLALGQFADESLKAEVLQAAAAIAKNLGPAAREDKAFLELSAWQGNADYWRVEDGVIVGHSDQPVPRTTYLWAPGAVADFYLSVDIMLEPDTCNSGIQFRSEKRGEAGDAYGCQADAGRDVWGRLYDQGGRGKLDWTDRAEKAVKPGQWNRYEILAVGPAVWTAINGQLGVACLDIGEECERSGQIALQLHAGPPPTVHYRIQKLVHDPKLELAGLSPEELIAALKVP